MNAAVWMDIHDVTHFFSRDGADERRFVVLMFDVAGGRECHQLCVNISTDIKAFHLTLTRRWDSSTIGVICPIQRFLYRLLPCPATAGMILR